MVRFSKFTPKKDLYEKFEEKNFVQRIGVVVGGGVVILE